jgi:hypothetical protein
MKKILLLVLTFAVFFLGSWFIRRELSGKKSAKGVPLTNFKMKSEMIDLGKIYKMDTVIKCDFIIYNLGAENLYIFDVKPDCKCTAYSKIDKTKPVPPNDSSVITLKYKPKAPGAFQVTATVETNAENNAFLILRGEVANSTSK